MTTQDDLIAVVHAALEASNNTDEASALSHITHARLALAKAIQELIALEQTVTKRQDALIQVLEDKRSKPPGITLQFGVA